MSCTCETLESKLLQIEQLIITQNATIQTLQSENQSLIARVVALENASYELNITNAVKSIFGVN